MTDKDERWPMMKERIAALTAKVAEANRRYDDVANHCQALTEKVEELEKERNGLVKENNYCKKCTSEEVATLKAEKERLEGNVACWKALAENRAEDIVAIEKDNKILHDLIKSPIRDTLILGRKQAIAAIRDGVEKLPRYGIPVYEEEGAVAEMKNGPLIDRDKVLALPGLEGGKK